MPLPWHGHRAVLRTGPAQGGSTHGSKPQEAPKQAARSPKRLSSGMGSDRRGAGPPSPENPLWQTHHSVDQVHEPGRVLSHQVRWAQGPETQDSDPRGRWGDISSPHAEIYLGWSHASEDHVCSPNREGYKVLKALNNAVQVPEAQKVMHHHPSLRILLRGTTSLWTVTTTL